MRRGCGKNGNPPKDRKLDRHLNKVDRHLDNGDRHAHRLIDPYDFACVDGEGLAVPPGIPQPYVLMVSSTGASISNPQGLSTGQCLDFLFSLGKRSLWLFGGTYDVNQWLCDLKPNQLERLRDVGSNCVVKWGFTPTYTIKHLYGKLLQLSRPKVKGQLSTVRVWDMLSYVQCSFVSMLEAWKLAANAKEQAEIDEIIRMKGERTSFTLADLPTMKAYSFLEVSYLERAVTKLLTLTERTGYMPHVWYSPGSIAAVAMEKHGVLTHHGEITPEIKAIAESAYHGGRAEIACIGKIEGPVYDYDIHSAYPSIAVTVPSFADGSWEHVASVDLDDPTLVALCEVTWQRPNPSSKRGKAGRDFGPFPVRISCGSKRYPYNSLSAIWLWNSEVSAARGITDIAVHGAWVFHPATDVKPFGYLAEMYRIRAEMKEPGHYDGQEMVYKLIMNSSYGKLAQHPIGDRESRYRHLLWAGMITAGTRAKLLEAGSRGGVISFATDGIIARQELPVAISPALGDWEVEKLDWVFLVQSGIYFIPHDLEIAVRTRGIGRRTVDTAAVMGAWERGDRTFTAPQERFMGYRTALRQGLDTWRTWKTQDKRIEFTLAPRREGAKRIGQVLYTRPPREPRPDVVDLIFQQPDDFKASYRSDEDLDLEQPEVDDGD